MKQFRTILIPLCAALFLAANVGQAQIVYWSNNFDTNPATHWVSTFDWHVGSPNGGPPVNSKGFRTFSGANCASTSGYSYNSDGRLYCNVYLSGSNSNYLVVPDASLSPTLTFEQWYDFANALGYVEIETTNGWQAISGNQTGATGGWALSTIDLSPFAGQSIKIGFHFDSGGCCGNELGWYVDDVEVTETPAPPTLGMPDTQTIFAGQTNTVTITAENTLVPNDTYIFSAPASTNYSLTQGGVFTWTNTFTAHGILNWTNSVSPGTNTITVVATDQVTPALTATNSFELIILPPPGPTLTVPITQTIALGQTFTVTNSATNQYVPAAAYTFGVLTLTTNFLNGTTNVFNSATNLTINAATGVLMWTNAMAPSGTNQVSVVVRDNSNPPLSTTNVFAVIIAPPPQVIVPATQTIHAGQTLAMTISATNAFLPGEQFAFRLPQPSTNYFIVTNTGVLTWTNNFIATNGVLYWTNSVSPGTNVIYVTATDLVSPQMTATTNFNFVILPPLPPVLTVPANQTIYAGETLVVTNSATNSVLPRCTYTFAASGPPNMDVSNLATNGVLKWTTPSTQTPGVYAITVTVTDDSVPPLSATNSFAVTVQSPPPPTLTVPPTQAIYVGQTLVVTNYATNSVFPNAIYTFSVAFGPTNLNLTANGVLTWTPTAAQAPSINNIYIKVTDNNSPPLSNIQGFTVLVSPAQTPGSPTLTAPSGQPVPGGSGFEFSFTTTAGSKWRIDASTNLWSWQAIYTNLADPNGNLNVTDPASTNFLRRYYRAVMP